MDLSSSVKIVRLLVLFLIPLYGCAGAPQIIPSPPPPGVYLGPEVELLKVPTKKAYAAMDGNGLVHVLAATSGPQSELLYLVVGPEGVKGQQVVTTFRDNEHLSMAFDNAGRLHAIVDGDHLMLDQSAWRFLPRSPCKKLVHGGRDLACAFLAAGEEIDSPVTSHLEGVMSGCLLVFPIPDVRERRRLAIAWDADGQCNDWTVLDQNATLSPGWFAIGSDATMRVHVAYTRKEIKFVRGSEHMDLAYASLTPVTPGLSQGSNQQDASTVETTRRRFSKVSGNWIDIEEGLPSGAGKYPTALIRMAVDPDSGLAMIAAKRWLGGWDHPFFLKEWIYLMVRDGKASPPVRFPNDDCGIIALAPAGQDRFHALSSHCGFGEPPGSKYLGTDPVWDKASSFYYHLYRDEVWSDPVALAESAYDGTLASNSIGRALAIVIKGDRTLVGRWIDVTP